MKKILYFIFTGLAFLSSVPTIFGQQPLPCPPPSVVNYTLSVSPANTISAGTTVTFKVMVGATPLADACMSGEWFINDIWVYTSKLGDGVSSTSYGYSTNLLLNGDVVSCNVYQSCGCVANISATDNSITMNVSGVLPIELLNFSGNTEGGINRLIWSTASEINNKGFQIERLNTSSKTWDILGFVHAQGKAASYEFVDKQPLSIGYYRLRQIDNDGKEQLSKVINLLIINKKELTAYPNPTNQILNIDFDSRTERLNQFFQIVNILGQQVQTGMLTNTIDVSALTVGTYFLKVGSEQIKFHKR